MAKDKHCHFTKEIKSLAQKVIKGNYLDTNNLHLLKYELELALDSVIETHEDIESLLLKKFPNFKDDPEMNITQEENEDSQTTGGQNGQGAQEDMMGQNISVHESSQAVTSKLVQQEHQCRAFSFRSKPVTTSSPSPTFVSQICIIFIKLQIGK